MVRSGGSSRGRSSGGRSTSSRGRGGSGSGRSGGISLGALIHIVEALSWVCAFIIEFIWFHMEKVLRVGLGEEGVSEEAIYDYREERKHNIEVITMFAIYIAIIIYVVYFCIKG